MTNENGLPDPKLCRTRRVHGVDAHWCAVKTGDPGTCDHSDALRHEVFICCHPNRTRFEQKNNHR